MQDEKLIVQLKRGSKKAFTTLYHHYWKEVYNFTRLYINSVEDSEEIVQEVFIKIWDTHAGLDEKQNFRGYLFIITRNQIFNRYRDSFNDTFFDYTVVNALTEESRIEEEMDVEILIEHLQRLVEQLTPRQKQIFELSRQEYLSYKEIAIRLGISEKTVERHINEALRYIKKNMPSFVLLYALFCFTPSLSPFCLK